MESAGRGGGGCFLAVLFRVMLGLALAQDGGGMAALAVCAVFSVFWQHTAPVTGARGHPGSTPARIATSPVEKRKQIMIRIT